MNIIAVIVISVSTSSLFIVLSAFSGLKTFGLSFTNKFDPDFRIKPGNQKKLFLSNEELSKINSIPSVVESSPVIENKVVLNFKDKTMMAVLRGVCQEYSEIVQIDSLLISGRWLEKGYSEVIISSSIARQLNLGIYDYSDLLKIIVPRKLNTSTINFNPFKNETALVAGIYSSIEDMNKFYIFSNIDFARKIFQKEFNEFDFIDLKIQGKPNIKKLNKSVFEILNTPLIIESRKELNSSVYKMLNTENIILYFIFSLIVVISLFSVFGSIVIMYLDKKKEFFIFHAIGIVPKQIQQIFFFLGCCISWVGSFMGFLLGLIIVIFQKNFPFLYVPSTSLAYPVEIHFENCLIVLLTVFLLGTITSFIATAGIKKRAYLYLS
ncbi:MAG: ABC transporter permease [Flavobacteriaceae bacterium]|tara:strand:- start:21 stop:1160 length:1140 start_codon:yes stop_codon:yes gene_type:complete